MVKTSHVTCNIQSEYFISLKCTDATMKIGYGINSTWRSKKRLQENKSQIEASFQPL